MATPRRAARGLVLRSACGLAALAGGIAAGSDSAPAILQWFDSTYATQANRVADFFMAGYGSTWIPPTGRADSGNQSVGYDVFNRFDLGSTGNQTLYGSEAGLRRFVDVMHRSSGSVVVDLVWNHNGFSDLGRPGFLAEGGYPGFVMTTSGAIDGDFHGKFEGGDLNGRLAGLIDIKHETDFRFIRTPVDPSDPRNIPAGTKWNIPTASNARFYADRDQPGLTRYNPLTGQTVTLYDFNTADPTAGDAVPENATGLLMRNARWLVNDVGVDGFRLDAARHFEPWVYGYFDEAVYGASRRTLLNGDRREVFSYSESASTDRANLLSQFVRKDIDSVPAGQIGGNRDALDFAQFWPIKQNLSATGVGNDFRNMVNAGLDVYDDGFVNGSSGVVFVQSHDDFGPDLMNVAYAFSLMRPGNAIVYYNAYEHYDPLRAFPKPGRGDALGNFADTITTLVDLRSRYGRGDYRERLLEKENYAFERSGSALVMLSNRNDSGFDARSMSVDFALGSRLVELTGNAAQANLLSGTSTIPEVLEVVGSGSSRFVNARFLRNGGQDQGYLVYGLPTPRSAAGIEFSGPGAGPVIAGDAPPTFAGGETADETRTIMIANATSRLADLRVINGDSFTVRLATQAVTLPGGYRDRSADGDQAMLRINEGLDLNGNGGVDVVAPGDVSYGFENFTTTRVTGFSQADGNGLFEQAIDATLLPEGMNFLTVRAYRHRNPATGGDGGPAAYSDFKQVLYVDRLAPESGFEAFQPFAGGAGNNDVWIKSPDGTADSMHVFQNVPAAVTEATILAWADAGQGAADRLDADVFKTGFFGVPKGNNTYSVVTREVTGNWSVRRFTGRMPDSGRGAGFGDLDSDGVWTAADLSDSGFGFERVHNSRNTEFHPAADVTGDGLVDTRDMLALETSLAAAGSGAAAALTELGTVKFRRVNYQNDSALNETDLALLRVHVGLPLAPEAAWIYDLDVDGAVTDADVTMAQQQFGVAPTATVPTTLNWTGNDALPGGSGTWSNTGLGWRGGVTAGGTLAMPLVPGSKAVFSGSSATVTVSGSVRALGGIDVQTTGQTTLAGGTIALGAAAGGGNAVNVANASTALVTGRITGSEGLVKTGGGRLTLSGGNTYTGTTVVAAGTLALGNNGTTGSVAGEILVETGGTLLLNRSNAMTMSAAISGAGGIVQAGSGSTALTAANPRTGPTTVQAGTLRVEHAEALRSSPTTLTAGRLEVAGGVTLRAPRLTINGGTFSAASVVVGENGIEALTIEGGTVAGTPALTVRSGGSLSLADAARVTMSVASLDMDGGWLDIGRGRIDVAPGGIALADLRADLLAARNGGLWNGGVGIGSSEAATAASRAVGYQFTAGGSVSIAWAAFGDANLDGRVDTTDISLIMNAGLFGSGRTDAHWYQGDFNYDGRVTSVDIALLNRTRLFDAGSYLEDPLTAFGDSLAMQSFAAGPTSLAASTGEFVAVPEPAADLLAAVGGALAVLAWRRFQR
jgi:autotransporter-associated beta strand protein